MKVDMSPKAIENRLKLVGELTKACLLIRRNSSDKKVKECSLEKTFNSSPDQTKKNGLKSHRR